MKKFIIAVLLSITFTVCAFASNPTSPSNSKIDWKKVEKNYLIALSSENIGIRHSATKFIAEYRLNGAVQSLIDVLRYDKVERLRMAAALALIQLDTVDGNNAVADAAIYDGSVKVANFCEQLINSTSQELSLK